MGVTCTRVLICLHLGCNLEGSWPWILADFRMDFFGRKGDKKLSTDFSPLSHPFCLSSPLFFFYLFHAAVLAMQQLFSKQLSHPHQRSCEGPLHSVTSRSIWFSSACVRTCSPGSLIYWTGLRPRPAELPACSPHCSGALAAGRSAPAEN